MAVVLANDQRVARALLRAVLARFEPRIDAALPADASLNDLATAAHQLLDGKDALIVLDNLEPDNAPTGWEARLVLDVLKATGVAILVTARQEVSGVPPGGTRQLDVLPEDEARDLFAEYYAGQPWTALTAADQRAAEDIIITLGRHTLALTLAATYAKTTRRPLAKVAAELADPRRALTLQVPDVPRSVLSTFDLSYRDLPADAQRLFRAVGAVGTNELGREATLALARALEVAQPEASVDLLVARALARPSILAGLPEEADSERLTLHPLLREFAAELLGSGAERERAEDALASFYAGYSVSFDSPNSAHALDEANITAALDRAHARGGRDRLVSDLCWGMAQFWRDRGKYREGLERLPWGIAAAVAVAKASGEPDDRIQEARLVSTYGDFLQNTGRLADASASYEQSLAIRSEVGDRQGEGVVLSNLGLVAQARGQLGAAQAYYEQALAILREVGDRQGEGADLANLGSVAQARGQLAQAQAYFEQSLAVLREVGDRQGEGVVLNNLAVLAYQREQYGDAERYVREALRIAREVGDGMNIALTLSNLGQLLVEQNLGAPGEGCAMLAEAARLYDEMGVPGGDDVRATIRRLGCGG